MNQKLKDLVLTGLFIAIITISTMIIQIPTPTGGYVHIGDSAILIIAVFFGKKKGLIAGGIGSALADMLSGYPQYIIFTLIIKSLMGFVAGSIIDIKKEENFFNLKNILMATIVEIIMIVGYYITEVILSNSFKGAFAGIPSNAVQAVGGMMIYMIIGQAFYKSKIMNFIEKTSN